MVLASLAAAGVAPSSSLAEEAIFSAAGSGIVGSTGNGASATLGALNYPRGLTALPDGGFLVTEAYGNRVRRVTADGTILAFAGTGVSGFGGDGGLATKAKFKLPHGTARLADGSVLIADTNNYRIRRVTTSGVISTVAGTGVRSYSGDGGPAKSARISAPRGIASTADGGYLIADTDNDRIRKVSAAGTITTVAGNGLRGFSGDGGPAVAASLNGPYSVSALADGTIYIADTVNHRIRRVAPDGTITTIAGTGSAGYSGDGGPAALAQLSSPHAVDALPDGRLLIADMGNHRVRQVAADGTISTLAGTGTFGFSGEGGSPLDAQLFYPKAIVPLGSGVLVADADNNRVRFVGSSPWPTPTPGSGVIFVDGANAYATDGIVDVGVPAADVAQVRLSNNPTVQGGILAAGTTYPYSTPLAWDLADTATGGSATEGTRLVYGQWQRADGTWSAVKMDSIVLDTVPPETTAPVASFTAGTSLGTSTIPVRLDWSGSDATSGIATYELQASAGGATPTTTTTTSTASTQSLAPGREYGYSVRASDRAGNTGAGAVAPPFSLSLLQETDPTIVYSGTWATATVSGASARYVRYSIDPAATATFTFTGRTVAWAAPLNTASGLATVELDGTDVATVNLRASSSIARRIVYAAKWPTSGQHTLKIKNAGTTGTRINLDAFAVGN